MDDDLKMNYNETDENKSQKELVRKAHKILHGTSDKEKIKKALQKIDEFENSGTRGGRQAPLPSVIIAWIKEIKKILEE